jgi:prophage regulatory protein
MKRTGTAQLPHHRQETTEMKYIRFKELRKLIPLGRTTIWRMMREGRFPQSRRIGKAAMAWLESEVEDWINERAQTTANGRYASSALFNASMFRVTSLKPVILIGIPPPPSCARVLR